jgi:CBS-domain-containing membrane protein
MQQWNVRDVMTNEVLTVGLDARPHDVLAKLRAHDVSAVAVVDLFNLVMGVLTRTDLINAIDWQEDRPRSRWGPWRRPRPRFDWRRTTARRMMTAPAVTIAPDATLAQAGRLMYEAGVKSLLVTDHRQYLVGIVAATDLLKALGHDDAVRADVRHAVEAATVHAEVQAAVVRVPGRPGGLVAAEHYASTG